MLAKIYNLKLPFAFAAVMLFSVVSTFSQIIVKGNSMIVAQGGVVISKGDITVSDSSAINNRGTIQVGGNWINKGKGLFRSR